MRFAEAGITVWPGVPPLVALGISFFTSMGGVSGAFLLLPFQVSVLGYTAPSVSATNQLFNIVAIPSGVWRYVREGRMLWPLTAVVVVGTLPGVLIGAVVRVRYLPDPSHFKLFVALVLLYIGGRMFRDLLGAAPAHRAELPAGARTTVVSFGVGHLEYEFLQQRYRVATASVFALCLVVGVIGGTYGIGGGAIVAPFFVSVLGLPVHTVAGASLMGTFVTSIAGVGFYQGMAPFYPGVSVAPDWLLGALFGVGGTAGMYLGARSQKHVPAKAIKWMLAATILFTASRYGWAFVSALIAG